MRNHLLVDLAGQCSAVQNSIDRRERTADATRRVVGH